MSSAINTEEEMDDDITLRKKQPTFFDWKKFKRLFIFNKRIWKYIALYALVYFSVRKHCAPWYKTPAAQTLNDAIGTDEMVLEHVVGHNSHKPASISVTFANSVSHLLLLNHPKYRNASLNELVASVNNKYKNDETDNHVADVHISVWSFLLIVDAIQFYQKKRFTKDDAVIVFHHLCALITPSIFKYTQKGGLLWCWVGLYTEGMGCLMLFGALMRIYYQKKRPDLEWIKNLGDITFAFHMIGFLYIRVYALAKLMYLMVPKWCQDESNHIFTKIWMTGIGAAMIPVGWYWSFHSLRLVYEKLKESTK